MWCRPFINIDIDERAEQRENQIKIEATMLPPFNERGDLPHGIHRAG
jgi:hypothetical protein